MLFVAVAVLKDFLFCALFAFPGGAELNTTVAGYDGTAWTFIFLCFDKFNIQEDRSLPHMTLGKAESSHEQHIVSHHW